jgi:hypothetical protein
MKRNITNCLFGLLSVAAIAPATVAAHAPDSTKSPLVVSVSYFSVDNRVPYLTVTAKSKVAGKFQQVKGAEVKLYLDKDSTGKGIALIGKVITDEKGKAATNISPALAQEWKASASHTFIAVTDKTKQFDETNSEITIAKARITVDTAEDKNVVVTFSELKGGSWVAVKGVDIKIGIKRLGADLQIGDDQSYTTDSMGRVKAEFRKTGIPGNATGNITLVAKVEDNDQYGNLRIEKMIPWGTKFVAGKDFFHRALWASQFHSPVWLVLIAYTILITVWGTLIYLVFLLIKIRRLGRENQVPSELP